jgi:hypothetical protein
MRACLSTGVHEGQKGTSRRRTQPPETKHELKLQQVMQHLGYKLEQARAPVQQQQCRWCGSGSSAVVKCTTCCLGGRWLCAGCDQRLHNEAHCHRREVFQDNIGQVLLPSQHVHQGADGALHVQGMQAAASHVPCHCAVRSCAHALMVLCCYRCAARRQV